MGRHVDTAGALFNERDVILITYGDLLREPGRPALQSLFDFYTARLADTINTVHILPFYPYSSDDGFSVIDYCAVNPVLGGWEDIERFIEAGGRLMFDAVINHISARSEWFRGFVNGDPRYADYFITVDPTVDLSGVTRPRALPLLTPVETARGIEHVWTTFSADQIDLNYHSPDVLLDIIDVLLFYIERGASLIRLDAIAFLWKEIGTSCIHLPQTHTIIQLLRAIIDEVAPGVLLVTETNVPHDENISYFGDGHNEAHMVYNFSLPPLAAHALLTGSASYLTAWAAGLRAPSDQTTFFNFTASHDGVGVRPATGILPEADLNLLLTHATAHGGRVSSKANPDGSTSPYELNITYFDLLNDPAAEEPQDVQVRRFLVSQAIMLALAGVPGIYLHSLLGSRNYSAGVAETGHPRTINREKLLLHTVIEALEDTASLRHAVFEGYRGLIRQRIGQRAFHPNAGQQVLDLNPAVFALLRTTPDGSEAIAALHNVSAEPQTVTLNLGAQGWPNGSLLRDLLTGRVIRSGEPFKLAPYAVMWLRPE
ncbi:MAG: alpha-amylase family glycosyl hydrolase [Anaerolineae bacterium]